MRGSVSKARRTKVSTNAEPPLTELRVTVDSSLTPQTPLPRVFCSSVHSPHMDSQDCREELDSFPALPIFETTRTRGIRCNPSPFSIARIIKRLQVMAEGLPPRYGAGSRVTRFSMVYVCVGSDLLCLGFGISPVLVACSADLPESILIAPIGSVCV